MTKKLSRQISLIILIVMAFFCLACSLSACSGGESSESDHIHTYNTDNVCTECGYELNYTEGLTYLKNGDEYIYLGGNTTNSTKVTLAAYYNGLPVTTVRLLGQNGIENLTMTLLANGILTDETRFEFVETYYGDSITEITIPDGVTTVEFSGNEKIKTANLPQTVTSLTIDYCENITTVNTPSSLSNISISDCDKLKTKTQDGITYLDTCVLSCDDDDLEKAEIREGTTAIYKYAFKSCESLSEVTIPDSVNYIGYEAFAYCEALTSVTFKNTSGWFVTETSNSASGTDVDVTNANDNATYLTDTYSEYYWYRSEN